MNLSETRTDIERRAAAGAGITARTRDELAEAFRDALDAAVAMGVPPATALEIFQDVANGERQMLADLAE